MAVETSKQLTIRLRGMDFVMAVGTQLRVSFRCVDKNSYNALGFCWFFLTIKISHN